MKLTNESFDLRKSNTNELLVHLIKIISNKDFINNKNPNNEIPFYIFGYPIYDVKDCSKFLIKKLEKNGFNVNFLDPNILLIDWN